MSDMVTVIGKAFNGQPAFTLSHQSDETRALLGLCVGKPLVMEDVGNGQFFLHVDDGSASHD